MSDTLSAAAPKRSLAHTVINHRFIRFGVVGVLSTLIDFAVYNIFLKLGAHIYLAGALGFLSGFANGYFFNSRYVFKKFSKSRASKYFLISLAGLAITELILHITHTKMGLSYNLSKLIAVIIVFFWNYILSKYWAFR